MTKIKGSTVLITGGAAGIGRLMGSMCLHDGAKQLIIWDINKEKLEETTRELRALHFIVHPWLVDVADVSQVVEIAGKVKNEVGEVDILINNAGIITGNKDFKDFTHAEVDKIMAVNSNALMHVTLEFLPGMIRKGSGHIVNISSAAGMLSNPMMSVYCASKWAVSGWSESMRIELEASRSGVHVTTVNPSYIDTGMFAGVKVNPVMPLLKPEILAARVVRAIQGNRLFVRSPFMVKLVPFTKGIMPVRWFDLIVGRWLGVYGSMKGFRGHEKGKNS
ncbi:MAG: SDR family oxidoreductase [Bacteroidetes bacterium]|nr:SDR family oxidoreductase [Bacteroidota bacterium]